MPSCTYLPKDGICSSLVAWIGDGRDCTTSNANGTSKDALHKPNGHGLLNRLRCAKDSTGDRTSKKRYTDHKSRAVLRGHCRLQSTQYDAQKEESVELHTQSNEVRNCVRKNVETRGKHQEILDPMGYNRTQNARPLPHVRFVLELLKTWQTVKSECTQRGEVGVLSTMNNKKGADTFADRNSPSMV